MPKTAKPTKTIFKKPTIPIKRFNGIINADKIRTNQKLSKIYKDLMNELKLNNEDKFSQLMINLDIMNGKFCDDNDKTIELFLISLYCNVFWHYYGRKKGQKKQKLEFKPFDKCNDYTVFTYDEKYTLKLLEKLIYFFNTDACNIQEVTHDIMKDLKKMNINIGV